MDESELNRLGKLRLALFLAADDRDHAIAAARALQTEAHNVHLMRALETAITVSYMRAFTQSKLKTLPDEYVPTTSPDAGCTSGSMNAAIRRTRIRTRPAVVTRR